MALRGGHHLIADACCNRGLLLARTLLTAALLIYSLGGWAQQLTSPPQGAVYSSPANVPLQASMPPSSWYGRPVSIQFLRNGVSINQQTWTSTVTTYNYTDAGVPAGIYQYALRYTWQEYEFEFRRWFTFNAVTPATTVLVGSPPTVAITSPASGTTFNVESLLTLSASASDPDGTVSSVSYAANGAGIGSGAGANFALNWAAPAAGSYSITATATDNQGSTATSVPVTVTARGPITGNIDGIATGGDGQKYLTGWACDKNVPQSINVHLYRGGA